MNMLTKEEEQFLADWGARRQQKRRAFSFTLGLPVAVLIVLAIFINILSGWYASAFSVLRSNASTILAVVVASVSIVVFMTVFGSRYQWEQREQRYKELMAKKNTAGRPDNLSSPKSF